MAVYAGKTHGGRNKEGWCEDNDMKRCVVKVCVRMVVIASEDEVG